MKITIFGEENEVVGAGKLNIYDFTWKLGNKRGKLGKLELEILEMSPNRTLENKAGSSPAGPFQLQ